MARPPYFPFDRRKGFRFEAVEGDWPDCYRVNRYVKGYPDAGKDAREVLQAFKRWPTWMWANGEIVAFAEWMRRFNKDKSNKAGFYGLDVYRSTIVCLEHAPSP